MPTNTPRTTVYVYANGTLVFDAATVTTCRLRGGRKVALMYHGPKKMLVIKQVPECMGGVRLTASRKGTLSADRALDFLAPLGRLKQGRHAAQWNVRLKMILVPLTLRKPITGRKSETTEGLLRRQ